MGTLLRAVEEVGTETTARAAEEMMRDRSSAETIRLLAENLGPPLADVVSQVAANMGQGIVDFGANSDRGF